MVDMEVGEGNGLKVFQFRAALLKTQHRTATGVDKQSCSVVYP